MRRERYEVARLDDLAEGVGKTVPLGQDGECTLFLINGVCRAVGSLCPHQNAPLDEAGIENGMIVCRRHGYRFDPITGDCITAGGYGLPTFPCEIADGIVTVTCWEFDEKS